MLSEEHPAPGPAAQSQFPLRPPAGEAAPRRAPGGFGLVCFSPLRLPQRPASCFVHNKSQERERSSPAQSTFSFCSRHLYEHLTGKRRPTEPWEVHGKGKAWTGRRGKEGEGCESIGQPTALAVLTAVQAAGCCAEGAALGALSTGVETSRLCESGQVSGPLKNPFYHLCTKDINSTCHTRRVAEVLREVPE